MKRRMIFGLVSACAALTILVLGGLHLGYAASGNGTVAAGAVEAHVVGRLLVDSAGSAQLVGYYPYIAGLPSNLFSGPASEANAYFTFRSSIFTLSLLQNGNILHLLSTPAAGTTNVMSVYFNASPNQSFQSPDTFSAGELIAQYSTIKFMGTASSYSGVEAGTLMLMSSHAFAFGGQTYDLGNLGAATTISLTFGQPLSGGFTSVPAAVAFGGDAIGVGVSAISPIERRTP